MVVMNCSSRGSAGGDRLPGLSAGSERGHTLTLLPPTDDPFGGGNHYYLGVVLDPDHEIEEEDETNNSPSLILNGSGVSCHSPGPSAASRINSWPFAAIPNSGEVALPIQNTWAMPLSQW